MPSTSAPGTQEPDPAIADPGPPGATLALPLHSADQAAPTVRWGRALLIAAACIVLQNLPVTYLPAFEAASAASLVHLQWGALLALAMLADRTTFRLAYLAVFAGWCVRVLVLTPQAGIGVLVAGALSYAAMYAWTLLCARWMGWPRRSGRARLRQSDILPYASIALALYPLGWAVAHALSRLAFAPDTPYLLSEMFQVGFARYFGVLCLTLPLVLFVSGREEPGLMPGRVPWWEWLLLAGYLALLAALVRGMDSTPVHPLEGLFAQRFMLVAVMIWGMLRLPWRWSAPLASLLMLLLVFAVAAGTGSGQPILPLQLLQTALELGVLQMLMVLTLVIGRDNRRAVTRLAEESRRDGLSGVPNINALRHDLARSSEPQPEIGCLAIEHVDSLVAGLGLPAQEALTAALHAHLAPDVRAYTLGMGRFVLMPAHGTVAWQAQLARIEQFEFHYGDARVRIEPHLGVCRLRDTSPAALESALESAYVAMQDARHRGETAPVFAHGRTDPSARRAMLQTHSLALSLLRRRQLQLHVQPIRSLRDGVESMGEILCRLRQDDGSLLMPRDYMEELEASRGVVELDRAVVETLLAWMRGQGEDLPFRRLAVNLTGRSLLSDQFRNWLLYQLDTAPGSARRLCFEITERAISGSLEQVRPLLDGLSQRGCLIALDDFGTGMQSFERLQQLPIDLVKIDGTFVRNIAHNPRDRELVRAMVTIARAYRAEIVAEYVEDAEILAMLRELQVDHAQGYHIGRPRPLDGTD